MTKTPWLLLLSLLFFLASAAATQIKVTNNPADQLVAALDNNRTAQKLKSLYDNPGLACIALQYIKAYQGDCGAVGGPNGKKPAESEFAQTFAPACGVLVSTLSPVTGRLLGCQSRYVDPSKAFSEILMKNNKSLEIISNKTHTEVGAGVTGTDGGAPYFWCLLFSNGNTSSSFAVEGGVAKVTRPGCFSGANDDCSGAHDWSQTRRIWPFVATALLLVGHAFGF
nr:hypothetical protein CFP56_41132 [Quercus suber]